MNTKQYLTAYNSTIQPGDYIFSYVGGSDSYHIIGLVEVVDSRGVKFTNVDSGRTMSRLLTYVAKLPGFIDLPTDHPELFI